MPKKFSLEEPVVVIIGSGAGGGTLSNALAQKGIDVVCLEAGRRLTMADIVNNEAEMFGKMTWLDERISEGDALPGLPVWTCKTVGGTTMHWTAACPRLQEHELKAASTYGNVEGTSLVDWPFGLDELAPYYDRAEDLMGVTGTHGIEPLPENNNYKVLKAGAIKVGYRDYDTNRVAINSKPRDGRSACIQTGFCTSGCAVAAKWSTLYTEIPRAEATGHFELRPESMVTRIITDKEGRVSAVRYLDKDGKQLEQKAKIVCVAGNAVETTRVLLNSSTDRFPNGLANSSDQVGRNYMRHVLAGVIAVMPGEVHMYKGAQIAGVVKDEVVHKPERGFVGGFQIHIVPFGPELLARVMIPGGWGKDMARIMESYKNFAGMLIMGEDPPCPDNRITLHPEKRDQYGLPVPVVNYRHHANNKSMIKYGMERGRQIYSSLGATEMFEMIDVLSSTHNMGTARMGSDPKTSVCNPWGQTHDISNLFVSDGSLLPTVGCENPTLTIVSLALRQADYIAGKINTATI